MDKQTLFLSMAMFKDLNSLSEQDISTMITSEGILFIDPQDCLPKTFLPSANIVLIDSDLTHVQEVKDEDMFSTQRMGNITKIASQQQNIAPSASIIFNNHTTLGDTILMHITDFKKPIYIGDETDMQYLHESLGNLATAYMCLPNPHFETIDIEG